MSNYTKTTDFEAKDSLPTGDSGKIIRGAEFETEFDAISTAIATKADTAGPTFTGTATFATISDGTIAVTAFVDEDDMSSDSATLVPTQQSVKAYVDSVTTELQAQDLDFQADSGGALTIDLDTETMTFTGGVGIDTTGSGNDVSFAIDSTVTTLTGTQTLTNKTLTSPDVNTPDIDGGTIDGTVIGGTTPAAVSATTVSATGNITVDGTVDGRDIAADGTKLDTVETNADVTDTANVTAAGALMDSEVTNLDQVKAFDSADYATAAQGTTADNALPKTGGAMTGAITTNSTFDGRDVATDGTKLDGIEASADVTDTTNVTAAGALMDSELTDLTAVKSLDQGVATTDTPTFAGLATSADVSFGDNDKAIFGAGSDLQIYHDGSASYIKDLGTGPLAINTNGSEIMLTGQSGSEYMVRAIQDGAVELFYDANKKLATTATGIDVTGTATMDGLTVDGDASVAGTIGVTADNGTITTGKDSASSRTHWSMNNPNGEVAKWDSNGTDLLHFITDEYKVYTAGNKAFEIDGNGDISFYEDTGTTPKLFWDASAESLGIGTSLPQKPLHINSGTGNIGVRVESSDATASIEFMDNGTTSTALSPRVGGISDDFFVQTNGTEAMRIDASGNVGIGVTPQNSSGTWRNLEQGGMNLVGRSAGGVDGMVGTNYVFKTDNSEVYKYTAGTSRLFFDANQMIFQQAASGTAGTAISWSDAMRIDASGHFLVGTSTTTAGNEGLVYFNGSSLRVTRDSDEPLNLDRLSTNGDIAVFQKDSSAVGSVGVIHGNNIYIGSKSSGHIGIQFGTGIIYPTDNTGVANDGDVALGDTYQRFSNLHLSGTVNVGSNLTITPDGSNGQIKQASGVLYYKSGQHTFQNAAGTTEYGRFDTSGNFLVGKTSSDLGATAGIELNGQYDVGYFTRSAEKALVVSRLTNDGTLMDFRKDGTTVGSIGTDTSRFKVKSNSLALYLENESNKQLVWGNVSGVPYFYPQSDNDTNIGYPTQRFKDLYLSGTANVGGLSASTSGNQTVLFESTGGAATLQFRTASGSISNYIRSGTGGSAVLQFMTAGENERARIDASGNLLVGCTSGGAKVVTEAVPTGTAYLAKWSATGGSALYLEVGGSAVGTITCTASATAYNTSSDQRLKDNIVDAPSASDDIDAIQVRSFDWKVDGSHQKYGMVAQELSTVAPEAVSTPEDSEEMMGVDYSKLVPMLVKEIQSLRARVAQLETN